MFEPTGLHYPGGLNEAGRGSMVFNAYRLPLKARRAASPSAAEAFKIKAHRRRLVASAGGRRHPPVKGPDPRVLSPTNRRDLALFLGLVADRPLR